ncbi:MAG: hypothetical protein PWP46_388 [Fusobacteriaceae bacterium]|jgi:hypothetical protein|nr:hypothetical protein [Fusobacteriales bacterium]MDN5303509.1 hypothetical protein [Fusobacteriaceae bacterium]
MQIFSEYAVMLVIIGSINLGTSLDSVFSFLILYIFNIILTKIFKDEHKIKLILSIFICVVIELVSSTYTFSIDKNLLMISLLSLLYSFKFSEKNVLKNILMILFLGFLRENLLMFFEIKYIENVGVGIILFFIINQIMESFLFIKKENKI